MPDAKIEKKLSAFEQKLNNFVISHLTGVKVIQKIFFLDHLRTMLHAGLSLVEALHVLSRETENKKLKKTIGDITKNVEKGKQLSEALSKYPKIFPSMYVKMIESGEIAGKLEESLEQMVTQMKKNQALKSSIRGAMIYPSVIVVAISIVAILMVTVVLPKIMTLFDEFGTELPLATRVLIKITAFFSNPLYLIISIISFIAFIAGYIIALKKSVAFKRAIHAINLRLPIAGHVIKQINLARFSLTLSSLLKSTIPIIDAVEITSQTCENVYYQKILHDATEQIQKGIPLSEVLVQHEKLFPPLVTEMIMVGERTGEIDRLLNELANFYSDEVDKTMKNFSTIIEPAIIVLLGLAVAGIAVAVIAPMFSLTQNF